MTTKNLLFFELNEVPFRVLNDFCRRHPRSILAHIIQRVSIFETVCEDKGHLSPWITWPSVHRGVSNEKHGIGYFGQPLDEVNAIYPPIWNILAKSEVQVGVFGSLHSFPLPEDKRNFAFYVPDTFATGPECHPSRITAFQEFNLAMVDASARNVSHSIPLATAAKFIAASPWLGITAKTAIGTACQLAHELVSSTVKCRRRTFQTVFAFDIFHNQLWTSRPQFATFFTNHVASAMHRYWAATYPNDYDRLEYTKTWQETYSGEIWHAMRKAADMLGLLVQFCDQNHNYCLLIASSMGQAASGSDVVRSQLYLSRLDRFMERLSIPTGAWSRRRAMQPDVNLVISIEHLSRFRESLACMRLNGRPLTFTEGEGGFFNLAFGNPNLEDRNCQIEFRGEVLPIFEFGLENVIIQDQAGSTGYHVPQGVLLIYDPQRRNVDSSRKQISTLDIAPAILRYLGVNPPNYMTPQSPLFEVLR